MTEIGKIRCKCGKVELCLPNPKPKFRCGCCCSDCLQRAFIGAQGKPPAAIAGQHEPIDLLYVDSLMLEPDAATKARLGVFRLNDPAGANISLRALCCGAVLCTENQAFHTPHTMATFNNLAPNVVCDFASLPDLPFHLYTCDWSADHARNLAEEEANALGHARDQIPNPVEALEHPQVQALISSFKIPPPVAAPQYITFQTLREGMPMELLHDYFEISHARPGEG